MTETEVTRTTNPARRRITRIDTFTAGFHSILRAVPLGMTRIIDNVKAHSPLNADGDPIEFVPTFSLGFNDAENVADSAAVTITPSLVTTVELATQPSTGRENEVLKLNLDAAVGDGLSFIIDVEYHDIKATL